MKIQIVLFDGFGELVAFSPYEVLNRANECGADFHVQLVSLEEKSEVLASFGTKVQVEDVLKLDNKPDLLIVPGGGWNHKADLGLKREAELGKLPKLIYELHEKGTIIAGICTGGMLMAVSGIMKHKKACMHHLAKDDLQSFGVEVLNHRIVDYGMLLHREGLRQELILLYGSLNVLRAQTLQQQLKIGWNMKEEGSSGEIKKSLKSVAWIKKLSPSIK